MSETARALGLPGEIEWQGQVLKVSRVTFKIEALFEQWLEGNRDAALERSRSRLSPEVFRERLRESLAQDAARQLGWSESTAQAAAWGEEGFRELAYHCIKELQPKWSRQQHAELVADAGKVLELMRIVHKITAPDPNGPAPDPRPPEGRGE